MLAGCLLRNFKAYGNIVFAPITTGIDGVFSVFTGSNGVGKSSILEAVDTFFYQNRWVVNNDAKPSEAYVAPLFLIEKESFSSDLPVKTLDAVSNYFWDVDQTAQSTISKNESLLEFLRYRDDLKRFYPPESYYLFLVGVKHPSEAPFFATFDSDLRSKLKEEGVDIGGLSNLYKDIVSHYSFVYIPVESSMQDVLKLESFELQELMDRDVLDEIDSVLSENISIPKESLGKERGRSYVNYSPLKHINERLNTFVDEINGLIKDVEGGYSFSTERNQKKNLSVQDVRGKILDQYFSVRSLKKDGKFIENLSSGEQRIALFDMAYSLLTQGKRTKKSVILAIDEPESSMHVSQCYRQFLRLNQLSSYFEHQVVMTSHWYGFLPVLDGGYLNHIECDSNVKVHQHSLGAVTSEHKFLPDEISLKSMFDLVSSIIGMMRSETANWLICEGVDDQIYLKEFLGNFVDNFYIIPMGGIDNVVKIYNYLRIPLSEKSESNSVAGRVVCLTDTDARPVYPENYQTPQNKIITIRRYDFKGDEVSLVELNPNSERRVTRMEDLLDPKIFNDALAKIVDRRGCENIRSIFSDIEYRDDCQYTGFSDGLSCFDGKSVESHKRKDELVEFLSRNDIKYSLANEYVRSHREAGARPPAFAEKVVKLFGG